MRPGAQGRTLDLSCRTLFMRCQDAGGGAETSDIDHDEWRGEPPAVLMRRTPDEVLALVEQELARADILRLVEPEWLDGIAGGDRLTEILDAFRARGGRVER